MSRKQQLVASLMNLETGTIVSINSLLQFQKIDGDFCSASAKLNKEIDLGDVVLFEVQHLYNDESYKDRIEPPQAETEAEIIADKAIQVMKQKKEDLIERLKKEIVLLEITSNQEAAESFAIDDDEAI